MAVISGVLKGPMGDARVGVVIELRAVRTSATVVIQARSQSVTDATGRYTLSVEPGQYDVMITAAGRQPERVGGIQVMVNSATGTLNDFLTIPGDTDLNPAIVATVDGMRAAAAASAAAAKTSENNAAAVMVNALSKVETAEQSVASTVLFSKPTRLASGIAANFIPKTEGIWASWSRAAGRGSADFVNHRGNGSGGYWFYDTDGATIKALAYLNGAGDLTTIGSLTSSNMYIGSTAVLKTGDYGLGSTVQNNSSNMNIDTALAVGFYSGSGFTSTAGMPPDWPTGTTHGYLVVENLAVSFGTACKQTLTSHPGSQFKPKTWYRLQRAGVWDSWQLLWDTTNTTVDANGFIKKASPIVKLFGDGQCELNDESQGVTTERVSEGVYRVSGTLGFNSDAGWGGVDGGIEIPIDRNKLPLVWVDYEVDEYGDLLLKTFHRVNSTAPKFAQNVKTGYKEGQPIDIPAGRWIDLRVEMPGGDEPEYEPVPEDEEAPEVAPEVTDTEGGEEQVPGERPAPNEELNE
ncbi:prophage tail fiber N-terminal domain-containing protein [Serratia fonticola]|uniref:phage tail fiber protein n=1 Tax=Serratia fonticola TaxID=47917 RepID=UPI001ED93347|nr:prophage tail fiber N-terminal domain-containing protein [Serratia fonticola]